MNFSDSQCFLCGEALAYSGSREHVFPRWLLARFNLWDQLVTLLNQTQIAYRDLTIPCYTRCNSEHLARLEQVIEGACTRGPGHVASLDRLQLYQWAGKIFYGLLFRELSLDRDRSDPDGGGITSPDMMQDFGTLHGFLQSISRPMEFSNFFPGTVLVLGIEKAPGIAEFDYSDNFITMTFCMRMGSVGLISCLIDDEVILRSLSDIFQAVEGARLHPIQYDELCAIVFYKASTLARAGGYVIATPPAGPSTVYKLPGFSLMPVFGEWENQTSACFLAQFWAKWGVSYDEIYSPPDSIRSYLAGYL